MSVSATAVCSGRADDPAVGTVAYNGHAIGSDVVVPLWGSVSGSGLTAAPFGLDWTKVGWSPPPGRGSFQGSRPAHFLGSLVGGGRRS